MESSLKGIGKFASQRAKLHIKLNDQVEPKRGYSGIQNFEEMKKKYLMAGVLFEDPEFPADNDSTNMKVIESRQIIWKRPKV